MLIDEGPSAVTLKAVAAQIGRTHANLLHHFGSAQGLQKALIGRLAAGITATIRDAVLQSRIDQQGPAEIVRLTFDAFDQGGAGALATWMILTGNKDALDPILAAIHDLVDELVRDGDSAVLIQEQTMELVLLAIGDSLMGAPLARALDLPRDRARDLAIRSLTAANALLA